MALSVSLPYSTQSQMCWIISQLKQSYLDMSGSWSGCWSLTEWCPLSLQPSIWWMSTIDKETFHGLAQKNKWSWVLDLISYQGHSPAARPQLHDLCWLANCLWQTAGVWSLILSSRTVASLSMAMLSIVNYLSYILSGNLLSSPQISRYKE